MLNSNIPLKLLKIVLSNQSSIEYAQPVVVIKHPNTTVTGQHHCTIISVSFGSWGAGGWIMRLANLVLGWE